MRYLSIVWDDGFRASSIKTAKLFESFGLTAEFYVTATAAQQHNRWYRRTFGDFDLWNELQARGHHIEPHGYNHTDKSALPFEEATELIERCFTHFDEHLEGFQRQRAIFGFPFNASTPELEAWVPTKVAACRTGPGPSLNPLPTADTTKLLTCGWEDAETHFEITVNDLLARQSGWLIYNAHGLDGEGWGPMRSSFVRHWLEQLVTRDDVELLTCRQMLEKVRA